MPLGALLIAAWSRRWMADDAFIYLRVVDNLQHGLGPVFNSGERVEAFTSPVWLALLTTWSAALGFVAREWVAVVLGLLATLGGVAAAMRGAFLLWSSAGRRGLGLPLGALVVAALAPYWDFATSGLETALTFAWLGISFWALASAVLAREPRAPGLRWTPRFAAVAIGLGPLVRPDLALFSIAFLVALLISLRPSRGEGLALTGFAAALPLAYELFRMGYFAELGPNTAFAKEAGGAEWSRGWHYLADLVTPYSLWIPLGALAALAGFELARRRSREAVALASSAVCGALLHALYVVRVGGDFMHARLLLPSLFGLLLPVAFVIPRSKLAWVSAAVVVPWAIVCAAALRPGYAGTERIEDGIADERAQWTLRADRPHPVTLDSWSESADVRDGRALRRIAERRGARIMVLTPPGAGLLDPGLPSVPPKPDLPVGVVGTFSTIGRAAYAAGPDVLVVDRLGLGDALAARLRVEPGPGRGGKVVAHPRRIGHEKFLPVEWVVARYGDPNHKPPLPRGVAVRVEAARKALGCGDLEKVAAATALPMSPHRFLANLRLAVTLNGFRMPRDPVAAERALCAPTTR